MITLGIVLLVIGAVLAILGALGRGIGGHSAYYKLDGLTRYHRQELKASYRS